MRGLLVGASLVVAYACQNGDCAPDEPASSGASMLQVHASMVKAESVGGMSEFVVALAEKVAGHNLTVTSAERLALDAIRDMIKEMLNTTEITHNEDQNEVNRARNLIQDCVDDATGALNGEVKQLEDGMKGSRKAHADCRVTENSKYDTNVTKCSAYTTYRQLDAQAEPPVCMKDHLVPAHIKTADPVEVGEMEGCLEDTKAWLDPLYAEYDACKVAEEEHENTTEDCNSKQDTFEKAYCAYEAKLDSTCGEQERCHTREIGARKEVHTGTKISEIARKSDFEAGRKVLCYFDVFDADNTLKSTTLKKCKDLVVDTSHLDIVYPDDPSPTPCNKEADRPCDGTWEQEEYKDQAWYGKAAMATCQACFAPAPTPAPTPPIQPNQFWRWGILWQSEGSQNSWSDKDYIQVQGTYRGTDPKVESVEDFQRPLVVEVEMRLAQGEVMDCLGLQVFPRSGCNYHVCGYGAGIGWWHDQFGIVDNWSSKAHSKNGHVANQYDWHTVKMEFPEDGDNKYSLDGNFVKMVHDSTQSSGKLRFQSCVNGQYRNVKVSSV